MSAPELRPTPRRRRVALRDHTAAERTATPLELLFDLSFVVAIAFLAAELHHGIADGHPWEALAVYALLFIPIWWAWMSFTWFATAYDPDDAVHRILTLCQMAGVLAVAATIHLAAKGDVFPFAVAYTLMRVPLVIQWLRAARNDPQHRGFGLTYALGLIAAQTLWLAGAWAGGATALILFAIAVLVDLSTPILAVRRSVDPVFHASHIAERYGLFALIVLGETLLAVTIALQQDVEGHGLRSSTIAVVASGLVIAFGMWWIYFDALGRDGLRRNRRAAFVWGYGHYLLYAAFAAIGAGVQAQIDLLNHDQDGPLAAAAVALPVAASLAAVGWLQSAANRKIGQSIPLFAGAGVCILIALVSMIWPSAAIADVAVALTVGVTVVISRGQRGATTVARVAAQLRSA